MNDKLEVQTEARGERVRIYTLSGNLFGTSEGYAFQEEVRQAKSDGVNGIVIDFAGVRRIDSSGVGIVVSLMWSVSQSGGRLIVAALPDRIKEVLKIAMLLDHIDHAETLQEAIAKLDGK